MLQFLQRYFEWFNRTSLETNLKSIFLNFSLFIYDNSSTNSIVTLLKNVTRSSRTSILKIDVVCNQKLFDEDSKMFKKCPKKGNLVYFRRLSTDDAKNLFM